MSRNIIKRGYTIVTVAQLSLSFIALFISSFIWNNGDVYIQLGYNGYGWQTLIIACLFIILIINLISSLTQLSGTNIFQEYGKFKLLIIYGFCSLMTIIAAALETWNCKLAANAENNILHPRFVITAVLTWLLVLSHVIMILIILLI
ncbi:Uncharacterized protein BM_BM3239 [Brugia malayi]|uniref:MARVEL domain-containing protein n=1 Tax=Brugia malayi TaxID=6279 RepID=A0A4E9EZ89_BRUMA|nr:Uncharacterized protein BM_BM3239 [Brugia malayi]VIO89669.1 Uncharacterized protein BM_BM3239 [Brugia malayi]